jgi:hypothetical protein
MPRASPQSSSSPQERRVPNHSLSSDANIRNFAPVARIMKTALPENAKIAKEAKECMQECVSEFISFITSEGMWWRWWSLTLPSLIPRMLIPLTDSFREMSAGEAEDSQWRGYPVRHDLARLRELCGGTQDLPIEISRSKLIRLPHPFFPCFGISFVAYTWPKT